MISLHTIGYTVCKAACARPPPHASVPDVTVTLPGSEVTRVALSCSKLAAQSVSHFPQAQIQGIVCAAYVWDQYADVSF